ncbi:MAG: type II toxin-antitoxin system prevent-host-death family antitoxin [Candidatus Eremiobacteraeota bacterium]|nr:type II toxin-antitoxin system prevent-host-death family antitoxin [Candidatus Eremiobacteraeota bacterium]
MATVGVRELKQHLSQYLARVRDGERLLVSDRGKVVALISPAGPAPEEELPQTLADLVREGKVTWGGGTVRGLDTPVRLTGGELISETILRDRR